MNLKFETCEVYTGLRWIRSRRPDLYQEVAKLTGGEQDFHTVRFLNTDPDN